MGYVSPGAYALEVDLSQYAETLTQTSFAIAHTFEKGVIGTPTLISNVGQLQETFGEPINDAVASQGWFGAREYLKRGNKLYINRVESTAANVAAYAAQSLPAGTNDIITLSGTSADGVTGVLVTDRTLASATAAFIASGVVVGDVLEICDTSTPGANGYYVITNVAATILTTDRDWAPGGNNLTLLTFQVHTARREAGADGATSIPATRTFTSALSTFTTNGVAAGDILYICDTTPGTLTDNGFYLISSVALTTLVVDRDFPVGSLAALDFVVYSSNSRNPSVADGGTAVATEFTSAGATFSKHKVQTGDILYICDAVDIGNNGYHYISSVSSDTKVIVNTPTWPGGILAGLDYRILPGAVTLQGATKGTWCRNLLISASRNAGDKDNWDVVTKNSTGTLQLEKVYNNDLSVVTATMLASSSYWTAVVRTNRLEPVPGRTITVSGGNDGYTSIADGDYIGNVLSGTGLYAFLNAEVYDINLIACPGVSSQLVGDALIYIAETRGDCMALIDPPDWATVDSVQDILNWHNGLLIRSTALNSSYGALYWAWQKVYDEFHDQDRWTAPSGHVAAVYANNDNKQAPWFAPAGLKRAQVIGSSDVRYSPSQDDREQLYSSGQNVNPIVNFIGTGITVFGSKTLQRANTALNRVNVRRMLLYVKKVIATAARQLVFDPNDDTLFNEFKQLASPVLADVLAKRGLTDYRIVNATTDLDRSNYKAVFKMYLIPTLPAEIISLEFTVSAQGTVFSD